MPETFETNDSKLAYNCRKAVRTGDPIAVTIVERGRRKEVAGRILDVGLVPNPAGPLTWQITFA